MYAQYVQSYDVALDVLDTFKPNKKFQEFLRVTRGHLQVNGLRLTDLLIMPVQRIPLYELLLNKASAAAVAAQREEALLSRAHALLSAQSLHSALAFARGVLRRVRRLMSEGEERGCLTVSAGRTATGEHAAPGPHAQHSGEGLRADQGHRHRGERAKALRREPRTPAGHGQTAQQGTARLPVRPAGQPVSHGTG
jgi:hypothetical protein